MKVISHRQLAAPTVTCSRCDFYLTDADMSKARREARKHVKATGHTVWVDWNTSTSYEAVANGNGKH
jgi:hypothetical protein